VEHLTPVATLSGREISAEVVESCPWATGMRFVPQTLTHWREELAWNW
jgi:hypothetical protein